MKARLAVAATTLLVTALAAGCGSDDKDSATTTAAGSGAALTKAAFIERADAICGAATDRINVAGAKLKPAADKGGKLATKQVVRFLAQTTVPSYERMLVQLRELPPPKADEQAIDGFVASIASAIDAVKATPETYAQLSSANPFADANKRAKAYGMKVCGS